MTPLDLPVRGPLRQALPNRRPCQADQLQLVEGGRVYTAAIGFDAATGDPREIFLDGAKSGSEMSAILADASILLSIALQCRIPPAMLARTMAQPPASIIGLALDLLVRVAAEDWRFELGLDEPAGVT